MKISFAKPPAIRRRTFLERLGLGAGAALLGPSVTGFVREARGQSARKRFVLMVQGNGMNYAAFAPPGHKPEELKGRGVGDGQLHSGTFSSLPRMFNGLEPHLSDLLLCDGLSNQTGEFDHSAWYGATTCLPNLPMGDGLPGGPSFDQVLAKSALGQGTVYPSMVLGPHRGGKGEGGTEPDPTLRNLVFAAGPKQPVPVTLLATAAYKQYIADVVRDPAVSQGPPPYARRKKLLDFVRDDARRVQASLRSLERAKLDQVLGSFETLDKRMAELTRAPAAGARPVTLAPITSEPALEERVKLHFEIWTTALVANLTNVVAFSAEATSIGCMWKGLGFVLGAHQHGHGTIAEEPLVKQNPGLDPLDEVHRFHAGLLAKAITTLKGVKEGDRSLFDNTILMWLNDGAEQHHPTLSRWPVLLAGGGGALKTGGRFVRYPLFESIEKAKPTAATVAEGRPANGRCLADLYITLSHALGVPQDTFGMGGTEKVAGPLSELRG